MTESFAVLVHQANHKVVAVQVDSCDYFVFRSSHGLFVVVLLLGTTTFYPGETFVSTALNVYQSMTM